MGRRKFDNCPKSQTLPSSPTHSSSSSDFEFTISLSPRKSSTNLCPADELFYKGQLLPLHQSPRLSMVRTLLLASSSTSSSSDTNTTESRDSTGSSTDSHSSFSTELVLLGGECCESSRPSSVTEEEDELKRLNHHHYHHTQSSKKPKYFSLSRFSSVFRKEPKSHQDQDNISGSSPVKRMSATAKEVIRKYLKKVKPLYEKISQKQQQQQKKMLSATAAAGGGNARMNCSFSAKNSGSVLKQKDSIRKDDDDNNNVGASASISYSFSGNLRYPRRQICVSSCPSSMRSSPSHSGVLSRNGFPSTSRVGGMYCYSDTSSMEELQNAIQGAIAHCKKSLMQNKSMVSNEN